MKVRMIDHRKIFQEEQFFPQCHASTIVRLENGTLISAWFAGTHEKHDDVAIWYSLLRDQQWSDPKIACDTPGIPCWNPVLFSPDQKRVLLYFKSGKEIPTWKTLLSGSDDSGETWSFFVELVQGDVGGRGPVKNKPILLSDKTVLAPASIEKPKVWEAYVDLSMDGGYTWGPFIHIPLDRSKLKGSGIIQPTCWESEPGHVHMLLRSSESYIYRSDSDDYGMTWNEAYPTEIPNNNSGIDLTRLGDGRLLLLCNPVSKNWGKRSPLTLFSSDDNGHTWTEQIIIASEDHTDDCEFSYPAVISYKNNVFATYTWKRRSIAFVHLLVD